MRFAWLAEPRHLILFDCVGAIATSLSVGILLTCILPTGLPLWTLLLLSLVAASYACFDLIAYKFLSDAWWPLAVVGLLNLLYCVVTSYLCWIYSSRLTTIGFAYFAIEIAIVVPLAIAELVLSYSCHYQSRTQSSKQ